MKFKTLFFVLLLDYIIQDDDEEEETRQQQGVTDYRPSGLLIDTSLITLKQQCDKLTIHALSLFVSSEFGHRLVLFISLSEDVSLALTNSIFLFLYLNSIVCTPKESQTFHEQEEEEEEEKGKKSSKGKKEKGEVKKKNTLTPHD